MGIGLSRRCFQCKEIIGWDAKHCAYCRYREGNQGGERAHAVPLLISEAMGQVINGVRAAFAKFQAK